MCSGITVYHARMRILGRIRLSVSADESTSVERQREAIEQSFLDDFGDEDATYKVWVSGDAEETALRDALAAFDELSQAAGTMTSRSAKDRLQRQLAALDARIAELEVTPVQGGRYEDRPTGKTYRELWEEAATDDQKRDLLNKFEISVRLGHKGVRGQGVTWYTAVTSPKTRIDSQSIHI